MPQSDLAKLQKSSVGAEALVCPLAAERRSIESLLLVDGSFFYKMENSAAGELSNRNVESSVRLRRQFQLNTFHLGVNVGGFRKLGLKASYPDGSVKGVISALAPLVVRYRIAVEQGNIALLQPFWSSLLAQTSSEVEFTLLVVGQAPGKDACTNTSSTNVTQSIDSHPTVASPATGLRIEARLASETVPIPMGIYATDAGGDSVWLCPNTAGMDARWSWGDPTRLVSQSLSQFDEVWAKKGTPVDVRTISAQLMTQPDVVKLFPHQEEAIRKWEENGFRGIFRMCTGAGKTIASLAGIRRLESALSSSNKHLGAVVIACPTQVLVEQWEKEICEFGLPDPLLVYESYSRYIQQLGPALDATRHRGLRIIVTTYASLTDEVFRAQIRMATENGADCLLIADEMHNCGASAKRAFLRETEQFFVYRLGLSATPEIEGLSHATKDLFSYFGGVVASYTLQDAIEHGVLCQYEYYPRPTFLSPEVSAQYLAVLQQIDDDSDEQDQRIELYGQRRDLLRRSEVYLESLEKVLRELKKQEPISHLLVYCPPGRASHDDEQKLLVKVKKVLQEHDLLTSSITANTPMAERPGILREFESGGFQVLLGIACLDEGLNVPAIKTAIMLYSLDRSRQFVQRRGRILRRSPGKQIARIHDIVLLPHDSGMPEAVAKKLLEKELRRYREFADTAINAHEAKRILDQALRTATAQGGINV